MQRAIRPECVCVGFPGLFSLRVQPIDVPMNPKNARFHSSAAALDACPAWELPEFAFIGRSNVGKSSLLNLLAGKNDLAKVSATPGKTQMLNFFVFDNAWALVDLPGYGYAKVSQDRVDEFRKAVSEYLTARPQLKWVFVLIDSRHPPQRIDLEFTAWLDRCRIPFSLVFTKSDKQSAAKTRGNVEAFLSALCPSGIGRPEVFCSSAKTRAGRSELLKCIHQLAADG